MYESIAARIARHEEEIRRLKLRQFSGSEPVGPWQPLAPYLAPGWDVNVATDGTAGFEEPFYYIDRGRCYMSGSVTWRTGVAGSDHFTIFQGLPAEIQPYRSIVHIPLGVNPANTTAAGVQPDIYAYRYAWFMGLIHWLFGGSGTMEMHQWDMGDLTGPTVPGLGIDFFTLSLESVSYRVAGT